MDHVFTIMSLNTEYVDETCENIKEQVEQGVASCALFSMTLVPEGNPPANKAKILCEKYMLFKEKLDAMGIPNGVLVQATIGHGYVLGHPFPYQRYVGLVDGKDYHVVCPYDDGFKDYIYDAIRTIAQCAPHHIMIDDDYRLIHRGDPGGCACPLHMKRFGEIAGVDISREQLLDIFQNDREHHDEYNETFLKTQGESLIETAKVMRAAIDSVDPRLPASYCTVGNNAEFAAEIAGILAGEGNPVTVRLSNGNYTPAGARLFSIPFYRAATQIAKLKDKVDIFLAETDTCPQNRYSTSAMSLHTHYTGTLLEGAAGAKHWITRLGPYEPQSGVAYRKTLRKFSGFYDAIAALAPTLSWRGCRIPVRRKSVFKFAKGYNAGVENTNAWVECVLERLGLPVYFSGENGGTLCLEGEVTLCDSEILEALKGSVFLASDSAEELIKRGFGKYLGVDVRTWCGKQPMGEQLFVNGNRISRQMCMKELVIMDENAKADSMVYHTIDGANSEDLFPGTVIYQNELGGTVVTFTGTPRSEFSYTDAFSFLNYSRKQQLIGMLKETGTLPAYFPGDEEVYMRAADMPDGAMFCAIFNLGLDPIENLELFFERKITKIEKLMPDGSRKEIAFTERDGIYTIDTACNTLDPVVLFAK